MAARSAATVTVRDSIDRKLEDCIVVFIAMPPSLVASRRSRMTSLLMKLASIGAETLPTKLYPLIDKRVTVDWAVANTAHHTTKVLRLGALLAKGPGQLGGTEGEGLGPSPLVFQTTDRLGPVVCPAMVPAQADSPDFAIG